MNSEIANKIFQKFEEIDIGQVIGGEHTNKIEILLDDNKKVVIDQRMGTDAVVEITRKCNFSGFFASETKFMWHIGDAEKDINKLVERIKKTKNILVDGPYGFSRRSTYIKRQRSVAQAASGNFVDAARVLGMVSIGKGGLVLDDISSPDRKPWFLLEIGSESRTKFKIVYDLENWWPITAPKRSMWSHKTDDPERVTSVLAITEGRLLTMHDKFVIDLAVKLHNEDEWGGK